MIWKIFWALFDEALDMAIFLLLMAIMSGYLPCNVMDQGFARAMFWVGLGITPILLLGRYYRAKEGK